MYEFTLTPQTLDDYVAMNDGTMSMFHDFLMAARTDGEVRYGLFNGRLNTHRNGETTTRRLDTVAEVREALTGTFLITLPDTDRLDAALEKLLRPEAAA